MKPSLFLCAVTSVMLMAGLVSSARAQQKTLVIDSPELAGISGFRADWNRPILVAEDGATKLVDKGGFGKGPVADWTTDKPGAPVFDAIHRRLLVRFPGAAEKIAAEVKAGQKIAKVELAIQFIDTEYFPLGYHDPDGMSFMGDIWVRLQPRWHAVAHLLRQPWKADAALGPTYNASINGVAFWSHYGAQDDKADRFTTQFGPTELSYKTTENRMDVTPAANDAAFGATLGQRLRQLEENGFILAKWETYDALYNLGGYEYGGAPGHRGIRVKAPRLIVTLEPGQQKLGDFPAPTDIAKSPRRGQPSAVSPTEAQVAQYIEQFAFRQPKEMPDWQWQRIQELLKLSPAHAGFAKDPKAYYAWVDDLLSIPYRQFRGHHTWLMAEHYLVYGAALPEPVREHLRRYFEGWLMPGRDYHELTHNQWGIWTKPENSYYAKTGDWRGNHSFYREAYTRYMSTMNFNHSAVGGALLGGAMINDPCSLDDGRYGLETMLLRLWSWYDGTTQESIDHYYFGLTLLGQKSFADLGPEPLDRLMGQSMLTKSVEELAACYHPALKRFTASSGRTGIAYLMGINEGPNAILHTLSPKGALHDVNNPDNLGMPIAGHDLPPEQVAAQALRGSWAPLWMSNVIDDKPLPFELTASYRMWGKYREKPLWKRSYLGRHYGLATLDVSVGNETVPVMAQWRRDDQPADKLQDVGTLLVRYGINNTEFFDSLMHGTTVANPNGTVGTQGGMTAALQHKNKAVVLTSPFPRLEYSGGRPIPDQITSLQSSIALANFQKSPTWKVYVGDRPLGALPFKAKASERITVHDGVSYIGIIPVPATDLGRTEEVIITDGGKPVKMQGGGEAGPSLIINSYNYYNPDKPFDRKAGDGKALDRAYGGFVVEMGDAAEYKTFDAFREHVAQAKLEPKWDEQAGVLNLVYRSGADLVELGFRPEYEGNGDISAPTDQCFTYRKVNGQWPYLPAGMERDTTLSAIGRSGLLKKGAATLEHQPGRMAYLLAEPVSQNIVAANPLPDPQPLVLRAGGGVSLEADGRLPMTVLTYSPKELNVSYGPKAGQDGPEMATALLLVGAEQPPRTVVNGQVVADLKRVKLSSGPAFVVPLRGASTPSAEEVGKRYEAGLAQRALDLKTDAGIAARLRYESGEHYILTEPRSGAYSFWRQWPGESVYEAIVPGDVRVVTDGKLALQKIVISPRESRVEIDYAPYLQVNKEGQPIANRAKALVVFGMEKAPTASLHGKEFKGRPEAVTIQGKPAWIIPLFDDPPAQLKAGIEERCAATLKALDGH